MKKISTALLLSLPMACFAGSLPLPVTPHPQAKVLQELSNINAHLDNIHSTQAQLGDILKSSLNLQITQATPTTPYSNWAAIQSSQTNSMPQANTSPSFSQNIAILQNTQQDHHIASDLLHKARNNLKLAYQTQYDLSHNIKPFVSAQYINGINQSSSLGTQRASNLLLLQDTKLLLALYQQQRTTQEILMAIALEHQDKFKQGDQV